MANFAMNSPGKAVMTIDEALYPLHSPSALTFGSVQYILDNRASVFHISTLPTTVLIRSLDLIADKHGKSFAFLLLTQSSV